MLTLLTTERSTERRVFVTLGPVQVRPNRSEIYRANSENQCFVVRNSTRIGVRAGQVSLPQVLTHLLPTIVADADL